MNKRESNIWLAAGTVLGVASGLLIAFILAPQSGHETRDLLKDKVYDAGGRIREIGGSRKKIYKKSWQQRVGRYRTNKYTQAHI
ncbi:MAG: YtxH domain-containing protein [Dehalococcoidia bacterium]|nr:YtxH domain-containing protein [Dehalococcoidia bacterium]